MWVIYTKILLIYWSVTPLQLIIGELIGCTLLYAPFMTVSQLVPLLITWNCNRLLRLIGCLNRAWNSVHSIRCHINRHKLPTFVHLSIYLSVHALMKLFLTLRKKSDLLEMDCSVLYCTIDLREGFEKKLN